jgi:hypothetical protein
MPVATSATAPARETPHSLAHMLSDAGREDPVEQVAGMRGIITCGLGVAGCKAAGQASHHCDALSTRTIPWSKDGAGLWDRVDDEWACLETCRHPGSFAECVACAVKAQHGMGTARDQVQV